MTDEQFRAAAKAGARVRVRRQSGEVADEGRAAIQRVDGEYLGRNESGVPRFGPESFAYFIVDDNGEIDEWLPRDCELVEEAA